MTIHGMDVTAALLACLALLVGVVAGWLLARAQLRDLFGAQAAVALQRNSEAVVRLADGTLGQREQAVDALVEPLRESLQRVQLQLTELERGRLGSDVALREQVLAMSRSSEQLRSETAQLVTALRAPQVRGRWGELQLERVVAAAGMTEHVDYVTQPRVHGDGAVQRPDLVVRLAGGKNVVVDSKVAFSAYLEAMQAPDESTQHARLAAHGRQLRAHIDALAAKAYWERFCPTPEFVVCFVPADAFLDAALRADPGLLEHAFSRDVVLATPSTLIALLRTVAYTWRQEALAENAHAVHELGRELYKRLATLGGHVDKLGRSLGTAVGAYNDAVGSLERRVLTTARRLNDLGVVGPSEALPPLQPLTDAVPRPTTAAEMCEQRVVSIGRAATPGSLDDASPAPIT